MMMQLGKFQFRLLAPAPHTINRNFDYRWVPVERVGRRPAMQFLGPGEETCDLQVTMFPHVTGGLGDLEEMRRVGQQGQPMRLVSASGFNYGLWCIKTIQDEQTFLDKKGAPRKVDFTLSLTAYGGDGIGMGSFGGFGFSVGPFNISLGF